MNTTERAPAATGGPPNGVTDEDLLHASQSAHFHCSARSIRFPGDLDDEERADVQEQFDAGGFEPVPVQVTARNRQSNAVQVRSEWDGVQLHLDVCPTSAPVFAFRPALAAMARYYRNHLIQLAAMVAAALILTALLVGAGLAAGFVGVGL